MSNEESTYKVVFDKVNEHLDSNPELKETLAHSRIHTHENAEILELSKMVASMTTIGNVRTYTSS